MLTFSPFKGSTVVSKQRVQGLVFLIRKTITQHKIFAIAIPYVHFT
jgi:hypothetical protein